MPQHARTPVWSPADVAAAKGLDVKGFGDACDNAGGALYAINFDVRQQGEQFFSNSLRVRLAHLKGFGVSQSNMSPDKYGMAFVLTEKSGVVPFFRQVFDGVRVELLANFCAMLPQKAAGILSGMATGNRTKLSKVKGPAKVKMVKELFQDLTDEERGQFNEQANAVLDDVMRFEKCGDGRGGMLGVSSRDISEHILNVDVYPARAPGRGGPKVSFYDSEKLNPKLELKVVQDGQALSGPDTYPAVNKENAKVLDCSGALIEMKKIFIKADNTMVSLGFRVLQMNKTSAVEEEYDLDAAVVTTAQPAPKRQKVDDLDPAGSEDNSYEM